MRPALFLLTTLLAAACKDEDCAAPNFDCEYEQCIDYEFVYGGTENITGVVELIASNVYSPSSFLVRPGTYDGYSECFSPASEGVTTVRAWLDINGSCNFDNPASFSTSCAAEPGDPYLEFEAQLGRGRFDLLIDFTQAVPFE